MTHLQASKRAPWDPSPTLERDLEKQRPSTAPCGATRRGGGWVGGLDGGVVGNDGVALEGSGRPGSAPGARDTATSTNPLGEWLSTQSQRLNVETRIGASNHEA